MNNYIKTGLAASVIILLLTISACKKDAGSGGMATLHGKVYGYDINKFGIVQIDSGYIAEARVYLSYGDHTWADDDTRTSYTGEYVFPYLQPGDYSVWIISQCPNPQFPDSGCVNQQSYQLQRVTINKSKETVEVPDLIWYY